MKVLGGSIFVGLVISLPETNSEFTPENRPSQKETIVFQPSISRCYVSFREGIIFYT